MKTKPSKRAWLDCVCRVLPGARQESLRFTAEKALSIKERFPYGSAGKFSRSWRRTPDVLQLERRLAGRMLRTWSCARQKVTVSYRHVLENFNVISQDIDRLKKDMTRFLIVNSLEDSRIIAPQAVLEKSMDPSVLMVLGVHGAPLLERHLHTSYPYTLLANAACRIITVRS